MNIIVYLWGALGLGGVWLLMFSLTGMFKLELELYREKRQLDKTDKDVSEECSIDVQEFNINYNTSYEL